MLKYEDIGCFLCISHMECDIQSAAFNDGEEGIIKRLLSLCVTMSGWDESGRIGYGFHGYA